MQYSCTTHGDRTEVQISGRMTYDENKNCRALIAKLEEQAGRHRVIDLRKLDFIDSAGLGLLLRIQDASSKTGSRVSLRVPDDGQVRKMLNVARFEQLIPFE